MAKSWQNDIAARALSYYARNSGPCATSTRPGRWIWPSVLFARRRTDGDYDPLPDEIAECAGRIADAMLAERCAQA